MSQIEKFLEGKSHSTNETTNYCSLLLLAAKGQKDLLKPFTIEKVREVLADRRQQKWGELHEVGRNN